MDIANEEIRRQLGFGQGQPCDMRNMVFSVKCKTPDTKAEQPTVPAESYFWDGDGS